MKTIKSWITIAFRVFEIEESEDTIQAYGVSDILELFNQSQVDILKMDVEGAAKEVFSKNFNWFAKTLAKIIVRHNEYIYNW